LILARKKKSNGRKRSQMAEKEVKWQKKPSAATEETKQEEAQEDHLVL
jgi:hypothetical protein